MIVQKSQRIQRLSFFLISFLLQDRQYRLKLLKVLLLDDVIPVVSRMNFHTVGNVFYEFLVVEDDRVLKDVVGLLYWFVVIIVIDLVHGGD